jgi:fibronectin-binding autotransporter adhesin
LTVAASGGDVVINAPVSTGAAQTWNVDGTGTSSLTVAGNVAINNITNAGAGALTLSGTNTGAGGINVIGGRLNVNSAAALGTGTLALGAGTTLDNTSFGAIVSTTNNPVIWNGSFSFTGTQGLDLGMGAVSLANDASITINNSELTFGGGVTDGVNDFALTKNGAGTLSLKGNVSVSGLFQMTAGTLNLNGNNT